MKKKASPAQLRANRENAQRSTGPRTPAGKVVSSRNALRHGGSAHSHVLLPGEDAERYEAFATGMFVEMAPYGSMEHYWAERVVAARWRLERLEYLEDCVLLAGLNELRAEAEETESTGAPRALAPMDEALLIGEVYARDAAGPNALEKLHRHQRHLSRELDKALRELRALQLARGDKHSATRSDFEPTPPQVNFPAPRSPQVAEYEDTCDESASFCPPPPATDPADRRRPLLLDIEEEATYPQQE